MKKRILLSVLLGAFVIPSIAQDDDMYFVPSKKNVGNAGAAYNAPSSTYHSGSSRSVDEYNRYGSSYEILPADTGDIISFSAVQGVYPDSVADFTLTQQMARWDDYEPSTAYWAGYSQGYNDSWGWHSPWFYSSYYPWYDSWYWDPWYWDYGWYGGYGWYSPYSWRWGYYNSWYYYPRYYGWGGGYAHHDWGRGSHYGNYRSIAHGNMADRGRYYGGGSRGYADGSRRTLGTYNNRNTGGSRTYSPSSTSGTRTRTSVNGNYSTPRSTGSRSYSSGSSSSSRSSSSSGSSYSGGTRSSGGSFGGGGGGGSRSSSGGGGSRSGGSRR